MTQKAKTYRLNSLRGERRSGWCSYVMRLALFPVALIGLNGCEFFYLHYTDCRYYDGARFDRTSLNRPVLNQYYADYVRVQFDDDRHIDSYDYTLKFSGNLPPGITNYRNGKEIYFEGTAISLGTYSFTIIAEVRYAIHDRIYFGNYHDFCSFRTSQNYLIIVDPV